MPLVMTFFSLCLSPSLLKVIWVCALLGIYLYIIATTCSVHTIMSIMFSYSTMKNIRIYRV